MLTKKRLKYSTKVSHFLGLSIILFFTLTIVEVNFAKTSLLHGTDFTILYSSSTSGVIKNCICDSGPQSGLIKRAHFIRSYRTKNPQTIVLSSGDVFARSIGHVKNKIVIDTLKSLKYTAVLVGEQEFINGIEYLHSYKKTLPWISADLSYQLRNTTHHFPPYKIVSIKNAQNKSIKVAIVGISGRNAFNVFKGRSMYNQLSVKPLETVLPNMLKKLRAQANFIVVLSHLGLKNDKKIAARYPEIDVIIGNHSPSVSKVPLKVKGIPLYHAGANGNWQGELLISYQAFANKQGKSKKTKNYFYHNTFHFFLGKLNSSGQLNQISNLILENNTFDENYLIHLNSPNDAYVKSLLKNVLLN